MRVLAGSGWSNQIGDGYEVSSRGDRRFSALVARLPDGRLIEDAWGQAKGYPDGRAAKGKPAIPAGFDYWGTYKGLWQQWADANPALIDELAAASGDAPLVDRFAKTENNQARALAEILAARRAGLPTSLVEQPAAAVNPTGQQVPVAEPQGPDWQRMAGDALPWIAAAGGSALLIKAAYDALAPQSIPADAPYPAA